MAVCVCAIVVWNSCLKHPLAPPPTAPTLRPAWLARSSLAWQAQLDRTRLAWQAQYHTSGSPLGVCSSLRWTKCSRQTRTLVRSCPLKHGAKFGLQSARGRWLRGQYHISGSPQWGSAVNFGGSRQNHALARSCPFKHGTEFGWQTAHRRWIHRQYHNSGSPMGVFSSLQVNWMLVRTEQTEPHPTTRAFMRGMRGAARRISIPFAFPETSAKPRSHFHSSEI